MLIINNELVHDLLSMSECIEVQRQAFAKLTTGEAVFRPRIDVYVPCDRDDGYYRWGSYEGAVDGFLATRLKSDIITWSTGPDGKTSETNHCIEPGTYCGLVLLFSTRNGEPLAIFNDGNLQHMRVGASAGIGTQLLAREDSREVGMIGTGEMARTFLDAIVQVRPIERVRVFSRSSANREAYASEMREKLNIEVVAVDSPQDAVAGADIVATATNSAVPTLEPGWIEPGMHVVSVRAPEISSAVVERADITVLQGREEMPVGDHGAFRKGVAASPNAYVSGTPEQQMRLPPAKSGRVTMADWPVYTDIVSGKAAGRTSADQVTLYQTSGNWGVQFAALCGLIYTKARQAGVGMEIPTELFLQDIRN